MATLRQPGNYSDSLQSENERPGKEDSSEVGFYVVVAAVGILVIVILCCVYYIVRLKREIKRLTRDDEEHQQDHHLKSKKERLVKDSLEIENETLVKDDEELQQDHSLESEIERLGKKKEDLQKQNETLKQEKEKVEAENKGLQRNYDHLKREKETLGKEKEDLQKNYESLKRENERLVKEKEDLQKNYESLKKGKEKVEAEKEDLQKNYDRLKRDKEKLVQENKGLQRNYDRLKREKETLGKEKEDLQKQNGILKKENEKLGKEKEDLQKQNDHLKREKDALVKETFKKKNEMKTPTDNSKEGLENKIKMLQEDFEELRRKTNTCGYVLDREWKKITEARVNVTLDPDTASPSLTVSEDGSRVRFTGERSVEWPSVLGREGFTSGSHYWEVEVGEKGYWVLGVSTHPPEKSIPEKPGEGYWLVRLVRGKTCTAVSQSGEKILKLEKICKVWGVYLDHEGGRLSFCNAETRFHIHTLEDSFPGPVYPIFSPGSHDKGPLIIQRVRHTAANFI